MLYYVEYSQSARKVLRKLDKQTARIIKYWIEKNLINTDNPRIHGKELKGNLKGLWRYRVGDYRLIAEIKDRELLIFMVEIGHRREIYEE